jgi:hypothetical protein
MTGSDEGVVSPPGSNLWVKEGVTIMNGENGGAETCPGYTEDTLG